MLYYVEYSLQCKPSLFSSDISQISYNGCHNVVEIYGIFVWNISNRFQNFMLHVGWKLGIALLHVKFQILMYFCIFTMCGHECLVLKNVICFVIVGYLVVMERYITLFLSVQFLCDTYICIGPINVCTNFEINRYKNAKIVCFVW